MTETAIATLLVEDNRLDARRIQQHLDASEGPQFNVSHVMELKDAIELLRSRSFQVILLDLVLPDSSDLRTVRRMLAHCGETPVVVLTNLNDASVAKAAVREGAQDYLPKAKLSADELIRCIQYAMERQELVRNLHTSERRWRRAMTLTRDAIWQIDGDGKVIFANEAMCDLLRREAHEVLGQPLVDFIAGEDRAALDEVQAELRETGSSRFQIRIIRGDGATLPISTTATDLGDGTYSGICRNISQWLETQAALRASERRYMSILESTSDAIVTVNAQQQIVLFNRAAEEMLRVPASQALGQRLDMFILLDLPAGDGGAVADVKAGASAPRALPQRRTVTARRADDTTFPAEATVSPVSGGDQPLFTAIVRDISEQEKAQRALRATTARFQAMIANASDLVAELDLGGRFTFVSPNHQAILGYEPTSLIGRAVQDLVHPADQEELASCLEALQGGASGFGATLRLRHESGDWRWFEGSGVTLATETGETRIVTVSRDMTARIEAMERLRESETRNRLLLDVAPDAIWILTQRHRYEYVNEAACRLFQRAREDLLGQPIAECLDPTGLEPLRQGLQQLREAGTATFLTHVRHRDGSTVAVEIHAASLGNQTYQCVARDVSEWLNEERAREASEGRYRRAMEQATEAICILDQDGRITFANSTASQLLERERQELEGRSIFDLVPKEEHGRLRESLARIESHGESLFAAPFHGDGGITVLEVESVRLPDGGCQAFLRAASE